MFEEGCEGNGAASGFAAALNHMSDQQKTKSQKQKTEKPEYILESVLARTGSLTKVKDESGIMQIPAKMPRRNHLQGRRITDNLYITSAT